MKITIKSMKAGTFEVEADLSKPARAIKEAIYEAKKTDDLHPDAQRLIYSGKLLKDDDILQDQGFQEKDFLVVMGGKRSASQSASKPAADSKSSESKPAATSEGKEASSSSTETKPNTTSGSTTGTSGADTTEQASTSGSVQANEESISTLTAMGFDRSQAAAALSAAFGNVERAVEYLQTGIPSTPQSQGATPSQTATTTGSGQQEGQQTSSQEQEPSGESASQPSQGLSPDSPLAFLHIDPAFNQLRRLVHDNPTHLPSLLQHLASSNPDLVQLINDNQEDFYHLINAAPVAGGPGMGQGAPPQQGQGQGQALQLSPEDAEAIERLVAFGFDRTTAAQAYFACDKDENAAANWLFEHGNE